MNIKKIMGLAVCLVAAQSSLFAARVKVLNHSRAAIFVTVNNAKEEVELLSFSEAQKNGNGAIDYTFNSGISAFDSMRWTTRENGKVVCYDAKIPSSRTMLSGAIFIRDGGAYYINFDKNGASSSKTRTMRAMPLNCNKK